MTTKNQNVRSATSRSASAGLFGVAMVVIVTACSALFLGFGTPTAADAQFVPTPIVITAPVINPTPVTPIILPVIVPVFTPPPFFGPPAPQPIVVTGTPTQSPAPSTPAPTVSTPTPTPAPIVVTGTRDSSNPADVPAYGPPCCTVPTPQAPTTAVSTPSTNQSEIVVIGTVGTDVPVYGPPCCTVPVTIAPAVPPPTPIIDIPVTVPPVIIPPVIIPPVIVPPIIPVPQCTLIAGPTSVQVGGSSVLTWTTEQATSFSINQNIGVVTPVAGGTTTVTPGTTTTYTGTATGPGGTVTCNATVTVTTTPPVPACVLTASATSVAVGTEVTLSYSGTNIGSVSIDQGVGAQASTSGSVVVKPTADTTYTGTFTPTNGSAALTCTVPVTIITGGGGGGCTSNCGGGGGGSSSGGGGGSSSHSSGASLYSRAIEAPLGAVYLSQIPYTGLDLGTVGTFMYWFMLVLWSLAAAYLVLFGMLPFMRRRLSTFGANVRDSLNEEVYVPAPIAHARPVAMPAEQSVHQAVHAAAVNAATHGAYIAPTVPARTVRDGFKSFATEGALTIDDIVKGLSRESGMVFATSEPVQSHVEEHASYEAPVTIEREVVEAPVVATAQAPAYSAVKASAPRVEAAPTAVSPEVPGFISAILAGERDEVFGIIRSMNQAGHDVEAFMAHAICALDDAYRARIDGTPVHADVKQVTDPLGTAFLEKLVTSLTTAVDGSYSMGVTGIKLALTRALAVSQG